MKQTITQDPDALALARARVFALELVRGTGPAVEEIRDFGEPLDPEFTAADVALALAGMVRTDEAPPHIDGALERFPNSTAAVALIAEVLKIALEGDAPADQQDTRNTRIRTAIAACSSEVRTRAAVVCSALTRVAGDLRTTIIAVKDEENDRDIRAADAVILPEGWLVVVMGGDEIGRVPFNPRRPDAEAQASRLANEMLSEYVGLHIQGVVEVGSVVGSALEPADDVRRLNAGEAVVAARAFLRERKPNGAPSAATVTTERDLQ